VAIRRSRIFILSRSIEKLTKDDARYAEARRTLLNRKLFVKKHAITDIRSSHILNNQREALISPSAFKEVEIQILRPKLAKVLYFEPGASESAWLLWKPS